MKFIIARNLLLKPLQKISKSFGNHCSSVILRNLLLEVTTDSLLLTGTDLEIEIIVCINIPSTWISESGIITIPIHKFYDICHCLPEGSNLTITTENEQMLISSGNSRYLLSTLPAYEFPNTDNWKVEIELSTSQAVLNRTIEFTKFSMANQDIRFYLNGMLFEIRNNKMYIVATDGHRLAIYSIPIYKNLPLYSIIVPRKGILELVKMLDDINETIIIQIGKNNIRIIINNYIFNSKLINSKFPDYCRILLNNPDKKLEVNRDLLKQALTRAAILSNEKIRAIRMIINANQLKIIASNLEHEKAEETLDVFYQGSKIEIGFNVNYILDVLNTLKCTKIQFLLIDAISSVQIKGCKKCTAVYVIMPMQL